MTKFSLIILFIYFALSSAAAFEISSKIDFDSDSLPGNDSFSDRSDPVVIVVENSNIDNRNDARGFQSSRPRVGGNVGVRGPVKPIRSHSNYPLNSQPARPKVIKNIYIIVNSKKTIRPENFVCGRGVCETTLSTDTDEKGNVIGSVRLTIVTKTEDSKIEDVPVIDGVRGTGYDNRNPTFPFDNGRDSPYPSFTDNIIPRTPAHRWDQVPRRNPFRPQSSSFYPRNFGPRKETPSSRGLVDDKIEVPLSQTNLNDH